MSNQNVSLRDRTIETIKQAHTLLTEQEASLKKANAQVAEAAADEAATAELREEIINKLSSERFGGEFLVPPEHRDQYLLGASTKEGMAQITKQLTDLLLSSESSDKTAGVLGEAAGDDDVFASEPAAAGLAALRTRRVRL